MPSPYHWMHPSLAALQRAHRYRTVSSVTGKAGAVMVRDGQPLINFASNDYLGLAEALSRGPASLDHSSAGGGGDRGD